MTDTVPVHTRPTRAAERQAIVQEYDSYPRGDSRRGALVRRTGVYSSHSATWRARVARSEAARAAQPPGPKAVPHHPLADELARVQRENTRRTAQRVTAETSIEIPKKSPRCLD